MADKLCMKSLEEIVVECLREHSCCLATIESCTGGLISNRITNVPGSSAVFWGGIVTYDNSAKEWLGVPTSLLVAHGAVSMQVAQSMAEQGLKHMLERPGRSAVGAPICLSVTGIAGPGGGTATKPVGLGYIALAASGYDTLVEEVRGQAAWSRGQMKAFFGQKALELVQSHCLSR